MNGRRRHAWLFGLVLAAAAAEAIGLSLFVSPKWPLTFVVVAVAVVYWVAYFGWRS